ncbi:MAG TPA: SOS response-associated peptidase [Candidatus Limnocylindria bacterium]|nr:SOS response-associated peptidase [Candidatus Limnocylindria bacterium]
MCGRFAQPRSAEELARIFHARPAADLAGNQFNVAPTDEVAAVVEHHGERVVDAFRWGLVPFFADTSRGAARLINARSETVETSPAFRTAFERHRCVVPADAFYEWRRHRDPASGRAIRSEPFAVRREDGEPMALAGLWSSWRDPDTAARLYTCTILTTDPNELVARLHNRMPVVLDPTDWDAWLREATPRDQLRAMLRPAPAAELRAYAVSPAVNNVRSEGPQLLDPLSRWSDGL